MIQKMFVIKIIRFFILSVLLIFCLKINIYAIDSLDIHRCLRSLEENNKGRIGLVLIDKAENSKIFYRQNERFPLCSTSKVPAASLLLYRSTRDSLLLKKKIFIRSEDMTNYNPVTKKYINSFMTLESLAEAALQHSDNAAMNLLLEEVGGPEAVTDFVGQLGDKNFRLDRKEPELNTAIPGDDKDTTTPLGMALILEKLILSDALPDSLRQKLTQWMIGNKTPSGIREAIPEKWIVADKTGSGDYGTANDIAVVWPVGKKPFILVIYFTGFKKSAEYDKDVLVKAAGIAISNIIEQ